MPRPRERVPLSLLATLSCSLTVTARAHADGAPAARLLYARADGAEACPDARALRDAVTMRLGYDPFRADAPVTVEARVAHAARGLRADVRLYDATGALAGERELTSPAADCAALGSAMALTISILVDPRSLTRAPGAPPPSAPVHVARVHSSPPSSSAAAPPLAASPAPGATFDAADVHDSPFEHPQAAPPPPPREPLHVRVGVAGIASIGAAPAVATGVTALVGLARGAWSLDLEGRADLPASAAEGDGSAVRSSLLVGGLVPCYRAGIARACVVALFGALRGEGIGVATPDHDETFYAAAGARFGVEPPIGAGIALRLHADALAPFVRTTLRAIDRQAVWTTPPVFASLGLGLVKHF